MTLFPFSVDLYEMPTCWFSFYQMSFQTTRAVCPCQRVTPMRHNYSYLSTKDARFLRIVRRWVYTAVTPCWTTTYSASRLRPSLTQTVASPSSSPLVTTSWYCLHWSCLKVKVIKAKVKPHDCFRLRKFFYFNSRRKKSIFLPNNELIM